MGGVFFPVIVNKTLFVYLALFAKMFASKAGMIKEFWYNDLYFRHFSLTDTESSPTGTGKN